MLDALRDKLMTDDKLASSVRTTDSRSFVVSIFPTAFGIASIENYMGLQDSYSALFEDKTKYNAIMSALAGVIDREIIYRRRYKKGGNA